MFILNTEPVKRHIPDQIKYKFVVKPDIVESYHVVKVTMYQAVPGQTDGDPTETASGFRVNALNPAKHRIIAVSHDLKKLFKYGERVRIEGIGIYSGLYIVRDLMNKRWKRKVDILINPDDRALSFKYARLYKL